MLSTTTISQNIATNTNANADGVSPPVKIGADASPNLTVNLQNVSRVITMADRTSVSALSTTSSVSNVGSEELRINATLFGGGTTGAISTLTSGRLVLNGPGALQGTGLIVTVAAGTIVTLKNNNALLGATTGSITVATGGTLEIDTPALDATRVTGLTLAGIGATENLAGGMTSRALGGLRGRCPAATRLRARSPPSRLRL